MEIILEFEFFEDISTFIKQLETAKNDAQSVGDQKRASLFLNLLDQASDQEFDLIRQEQNFI